MSITNSKAGQVGNVGVNPKMLYLESNANETALLLEGAMTKFKAANNDLSPGDLVAATFVPSAGANPRAGWYYVIEAAGVWSLVKVGSNP